MDDMNKKNHSFPLEIKKTYDGNKVVFHVKGRIDNQTTEKFQSAVESFFDDPCETLMLDFSGVEYLSSAGLRSILYLQKKMKSLSESSSDTDSSGSEKKVSCEMTIFNVKPTIMEIFDMTGFIDIIDIFPEKKD